MKKLSNHNVFARSKFLCQSTFQIRCLYTKLTRRFPATLFIVAIGSLFSACDEDDKTVLEKELDQVRHAVSSYHDLDHAKAHGYDTEVTGYRSQMGYHYLKGALVDNNFEITKPEILVYAPYGTDSMKFVAVEYVTPIADLNNPPPVPEGFTGSDDVWEINTEFKLWTLHVWVGLENSHGIFAPHNPKLP